ncbi:hypothetical protein FACS1894181_01640 [Bacteroidia bacterium]|nr:hypothetical protein FACS1894181_01640 [Bacteroidia bacterium]
MVIAFQACKPKQSTYKAAYEQAQQRDSSVDDFSDDEFSNDMDIAPVNKPRSDGSIDDSDSSNGDISGYDDYNDNYSPVQENLYPYESNSGGNVQISLNLKRYNVVIGSFRNATNATALKERMQREGYSVDLARNDRGMIRVIVKTTDNRAEALRERINFRSKHYPNFQDSWVLKRY